MEAGFKKPLAHQIREGVEIESSKGELMNSKAEWFNSGIPRIVIEAGEKLTEDKESGLGRQSEKEKRVMRRERPVLNKRNPKRRELESVESAASTSQKRQRVIKEKEIMDESEKDTHKIVRKQTRESLKHKKEIREKKEKRCKGKDKIKGEGERKDPQYWRNVFKTIEERNNKRMLENVKGAKEHIMRMEKGRGGGEHPIVKEKLPTEKEIGGENSSEIGREQSEIGGAGDGEEGTRALPLQLEGYLSLSGAAQSHDQTVQNQELEASEILSENENVEEVMTDEDDTMLRNEMTRMLRMVKAKFKEGEWTVRREERKEGMENEKKMRKKKAREKRKEWIIQNNNDEKLRMMQAILSNLIKAGVEESVENFDMREMKFEIERIRRLEKVRMMQIEWNIRMRIEEERRIDRETKEKTKKKRECEQIVWKCIENAMRLSDKGERKKVRLETVRKKEEEWKKKNALRNEESTVKELSEI